MLKSDIIKKFSMVENDTGSNQVQIGLMTQRISDISEHLKLFPKDKHSRYGLIKLVGKRRRFLNYLKREDLVEYQRVVNLLDDLKSS